MRCVAKAGISGSRLRWDRWSGVSPNTITNLEFSTPSLGPVATPTNALQESARVDEGQSGWNNSR